jgi:hypothetical protein
MKKKFNEVILEFTKFIENQHSKGVDTKLSIRNGNLKDYCIPYDDDMLIFFKSIADVPEQFMKQLINLHKFSYLIHNTNDDIFFRVFHNDISFEAILGNGTNGCLGNIINISIYFNGNVEEFTNMHTLFLEDMSYDENYKTSLQNLKKYMSSKIIDTNSFLKLYNLSETDVIEKKLNGFNNKISYKGLLDLRTLMNDQIKDFDEINFIKYMRSIFDENIIKKLLQILSISKLDYYLENREREFEVSVMYIGHISKFAESNQLMFILIKDFTLILYDNGVIYHDNSTFDMINSLENLDISYNNLREKIVNKMTHILEKEKEQLTGRDIELYKIIVY